MDEVRQPRVLPPLTDLNRPFWTSGRDGELRILRCESCRTWVHPPRPMCSACHGRALCYEVTSGKGTVYSFVVNHHPWRPGLADPYVIALVELDDQPNLRLTSNIVGCEPDEVSIGMRVVVHFVEQDGSFVPLFVPASRGDRG